MTRRLGRLLGTLVSVATLAAGFELACGGPNSHVLSGRRYLADRDCMESLRSVDVVEGPDPGRSCEPLCMVGQSPLLDGGSAIYVTTQCPPYPPTFDLSGSDPLCADALAALARKDFCLAEGSTNPFDAGDDAAVDAGPDAEPDASEVPSDASDASSSDADAAPEDAGDADAADAADAEAGT